MWPSESLVVSGASTALGMGDDVVENKLWETGPESRHIMQTRITTAVQSILVTAVPECSSCWRTVLAERGSDDDMLL
jgi:hypothetical protein